MRAGVYTGGGQGLPQASPAPLVHIEDAAGTLTFTQATVTITVTVTPGSYTTCRHTPK